MRSSERWRGGGEVETLFPAASRAARVSEAPWFPVAERPERVELALDEAGPAPWEIQAGVAEPAPRTPAPAQDSGAAAAHPPGEEEQARQARELEEVRRSAEEAGYRRGEAEGLRRGKAEGLREGQAAGHRQGLAEGEQQVAAVRQEVEQVVSRLEEEATRRAAAHGEAVARLAVRIAGRLLGLERARCPELLVRAVREAAGRLPEEAELRLHLHPADLARTPAFSTRAEQVAGGGGEDGTVRLRAVADERMQQGEFVLESDHGGVDARLQGQLDRILARLLAERESWQLDGPDPGPAEEQP